MAKKKFSLTEALQLIEKHLPSIKEESTLRQYFVEALNDFLSENQLDFAATGPLFALDARIIQGKPDAAIGGVVFELKMPRPKGPGIESAISKVQEYIDEKGSHALSVRGVAYDGKSLALLDETKAIAFRGDIPAGVPMLESWLLLLAGAVQTPDDMVARFGSDSSAAHTAIRIFHDVFRKFHPRVPFIDEVFVVWRALYACAANLNKDAIAAIERAGRLLGLSIRGKAQAEEFLFCLETYLAILLKLLVARVAVEQKLVPHASVRQILYDPAGNIHRRYVGLESQIPHLSNVFEQDTFVWFADAAESDKNVERLVSQLLLSLADLVDNVRLITMRQDFLQVFYQQFFDPAARRALGEFYTNRDLVRETLDAVGFDGTSGGILMDLSCGSGNFLVEAIARRIQSSKGIRKDDLLKSITSQILGADIHPLAVAMARVNYLICIGHLLSRGAVVRIPIYWADSLARLAIPQKTRRFAQFGVPVKIQIPGLRTFELPDHRDVDWDKLLDTTRNLLQACKGKVSVAKLWPRFTQELGEEATIRYEETLRAFLSQVVELHNEGRDMRWLPLLRNALFIEGLAGKCRFVVGNPPWVRIHNIEEEFRGRINQDYRFCRDAGWERGCEIAGIGRGFARQTDLCIPFVERSLELLEEGGFLGYVISSKIQQALYANVLRRELVQNKTIIRLIDYSLHQVPLFIDATNYPMTIAVKNAQPSPDHKIRLTICNGLGVKLDSEIDQKELSVLEGDHDSPWLMVPEHVVGTFRKLQSHGTMLGSEQFLTPRMGIKTAANRDYILTDLETTESADELAATNEAHQRFRISKELAYPLLRGENIAAWRYTVSDRIIFTHDPESAEVLSKLPRKLQSYFSEPERSNRLRNRQDYDSSYPVWVIFRVTPNKLGQKVCWCELSHTMEATYVPAYWNDPILGRKKVIPLQTAYLIPVRSARAGLLLTAILNSLPFRVQMVAFAERARGAYFRHFSWTVGLGFIPRTLLDHLNPQYAPRSSHKAQAQRLIKLATKLHQTDKADVQQRLQSEVDQLMCQDFGLSGEEKKILAEYLNFMRPPLVKEASILEDVEPVD